MVTEPMVEAPVEEPTPVTEPTTPPSDPPAPAEEATPPETSEGTPEGEVETFSTWREKHLDAEDFPHKADYEAYLEEVRAEGWSTAREELSGRVAQAEASIKRNEQLFTTANQGFRLVAGRLDKLMQDGALSEESLASVLQSVPDAWKALNAITEENQKGVSDSAKQEGFYMGTRRMGDLLLDRIMKQAGRPALAKQFTERHRKLDGSPESVDKFWNDALTAAHKAAYEAGIEAGRKGQAEADKTTERAGQRPVQSAGVGGGRSEREVLLDPSTPIETIRQIRDRQKSGG